MVGVEPADGDGRSDGTAAAGTWFASGRLVPSAWLPSAHDLNAAFGAVAALLCLRCLPMLAYVVTSDAVSLRGALLSTLAYALLPLLARSIGVEVPWIDVGASLLYCVLTAVVMHRLALRQHRARLPAALVFAIAFGLCLALPAWLLGPTRSAPFLVLGWSLMLGSYSYCHEAGERERPPTLGEGLFFMLVNPTLSYPDRGARVSEPTWDAAGASRVALGVAVLWLSRGCLRPLAASAAVAPPFADRTLALLSAGALSMAAEYAAHSGLASVQLGLMRQLGWRIPERYRHPFAARSPADFWRRWNSYMQVWARRYLFVPASRGLARRLRRGSVRSATALGALLTFVAIGVLHDAYGSFEAHALRWQSSVLFLALGALVVGFEACARTLGTLTLGTLTLGTLTLGVRASFSRGAFVLCVALVLWAREALLAS